MSDLTQEELRAQLRNYGGWLEQRSRVGLSPSSSAATDRLHNGPAGPASGGALLADDLSVDDLFAGDLTGELFTGELFADEFSADELLADDFGVEEQSGFVDRHREDPFGGALEPQANGALGRWALAAAAAVVVVVGTVVLSGGGEREVSSVAADGSGLAQAGVEDGSGVVVEVELDDSATVTSDLADTGTDVARGDALDADNADTDENVAGDAAPGDADAHNSDDDVGAASADGKKDQSVSDDKNGSAADHSADDSNRGETDGGQSDRSDGSQPTTKADGDDATGSDSDPDPDPDDDGRADKADGSAGSAGDETSANGMSMVAPANGSTIDANLGETFRVRPVEGASSYVFIGSQDGREVFRYIVDQPMFVLPGRLTALDEGWIFETGLMTVSVYAVGPSGETMAGGEIMVNMRSGGDGPGFGGSPFTPILPFTPEG